MGAGRCEMNRRQETRAMASMCRNQSRTQTTCNQAPDVWGQHQGGAARQLLVLAYLPMCSSDNVM